MPPYKFALKGEKMKKLSSILLSLLLVASVFLTSCADGSCRKHKDADHNGVCDKCYGSVFKYYDLYSLGGLARDNADVDEITDYINAVREKSKNAVLLSSGNMLKENFIR